VPCPCESHRACPASADHAAPLWFLVQGPSTPSLSMASRDLRRLLDGVALVAREATRGTSLRDVLRSALLATTDLAGLTRGTPRRPPHPPGAGPLPATESSRPSSVVYFSHDEATASPQDHALERPPPAQEAPHPARTQETVRTGTTASVAAEPAAVAADRPEPAAPPPDPSPLPQQAPPLASAAPGEKRRRLRERKVPSTPFTRALGYGIELTSISTEI
jgi:aarF domain-containing kinase